MKTINEIRNIIAGTTYRSAWNKGVAAYALELIADLDGTYEFCGSPADLKLLLNGADDWQQYSEGGCTLFRNYDIVKRLCSATEIRISRNGQLAPNGRENWIGVQSRALWQAASLLTKISQ
jgi:hypothetical protein